VRFFPRLPVTIQRDLAAPLVSEATVQWDRASILSPLLALLDAAQDLLLSQRMTVSYRRCARERELGRRILIVAGSDDAALPDRMRG
jgi:hypothetical protein